MGLERPLVLRPPPPWPAPAQALSTSPTVLATSPLGGGRAADVVVDVAVGDEGHAGRPTRSLFRARAAWMASHSRVATTPMKSALRTTLAPGMAAMTGLVHRNGRRAGCWRADHPPVHHARRRPDVGDIFEVAEHLAGDVAPGRRGADQV